MVHFRHVARRVDGMSEAEAAHPTPFNVESLARASAAVLSHSSCCAAHHRRLERGAALLPRRGLALHGPEGSHGAAAPLRPPQRARLQLAHQRGPLRLVVILVLPNATQMPALASCRVELARGLVLVDQCSGLDLLGPGIF